MTSWSDYWGGFHETIAARLFYFNREGPRFRALADIIDARFNLQFNVGQSFEASFDLDTAVGDQLDIIGGWLGLERNGLDNDRFRRALQVQKLLLKSRGTRPDIIAVWTAWVGAAPLHYRSVPVAEVDIGGPVELEDELLLGQFLRKAAPGGVILTASNYDTGVSPADYLICSYVPDDIVTTPDWEIDDLTFGPDMITLEDETSGLTGTADGTTTVAAFSARNFNGTTDRIDYASVLSLSLPQEFTVSAWVRWETLGGLRVIWVASSTAPAQSMLLRTNGSSLEFSHAYSPGTSLQRISTAVLVTGVWTHICATFPGTATAANTTLYINGLAASYATTTNGSGTPRAADGSWSIGGRIESDANCSDADIAKVRVFSRILTAAEVYQLYTGEVSLLDYHPGDSNPDAAIIAKRIDTP